MIANRLSEEAERAAERYALVTKEWQRLYDEALGADDFGSAALTARIMAAAYQVSLRHIADEDAHIEGALSAIAQSARETTLSQIASIEASDLSDDALEHLAQSQSYLINEIAAQMQRDLATLRQKLQAAALAVRASVRTRRMNERMAMLDYRMSSFGKLEFTFYDRRSYRWISRKFVRTVWRHTLLAAYNEMVLMTAADHGHAEIAVVTESEGVLQTQGQVSLRDDALGYAAACEHFFHPNSTCFLSMEAGHV
ncbi:hypothetical protein [Ancylobacter rudongensis]|uniref:Uncharacterized protein n=1 Tax=Ancylobacter rudongensis TaxID=177413 RepID=A0A1G4URR2_9HYPH|nr:hypothetical protein [Ancylobacter rudongensis]SCW95645.1 hypothetical protein SAMN05660859_0075 [Ancylobacter rudongensis]